MGRIRATHESKVMYEVLFMRAAAREFEALPAIVQRAVWNWIAVLALNPMEGELLKGELKGVRRVAFRVKGTEYRIAYEVLPVERQVLI